MRRLSSLTTTFLAVPLLLGLAGTARAQGTPTYDTAQLPATKGKVSQYLLNPRGSVDGLLLDDGTEVHVTPMISTELVFAVRPGDTVTIHGLKAKASPMVAAASITNDATGTTVLGRTGKSMHAGGETTEASGTIKAVLHEPHGAIDGVLLDGGTIIRLPPSEAKKHAAQLTVGQKLFVRGTGTTSPLGKVVLARQIGPDAAKLTDIAMPRMGHDGMMKGHDGMMGHHRPMGAPPATN